MSSFLLYARASERRLINMQGKVLGVLEIGARGQNVQRNAAWCYRCMQCKAAGTMEGNRLRTGDWSQGCHRCKPAPKRERVVNPASQLRGAHDYHRPRVKRAMCTECCNLPWQRPAGGCWKCGRPHAEEPLARLELRTSSPIARAQECAW